MDRKIIEKRLKEDNENWLIYDKNWINYWEKDQRITGIKIINIENKSFILYEKINEKEIFILFAYVYSNNRKQGLLSNMLLKLKNNKIIKLGSLDETTDKVWIKCGFECYKKGNINECSLFIKK